jgi:hypothetical protein
MQTASDRSLFMLIISDIITIHLIFLLQCSIINPSPLFSSKKIDSARFHQRAFFLPAQPECKPYKRSVSRS